MLFKGRNALVLGGGTSGKGAAYVLAAEGAAVTVAETDGLPPDMKNYDLAVVSPGVRLDHPVYKYAEAHGLDLLGETGLGAIINTAPVLGVTGTNGKTTVVEMLGAIYAAAGTKAVLCGNIGRSFARAAYDETYERAIVELSSFQLLQAAPLKVHIACITNLAEDHLDYHGSMRAYRHAKLRIADGQTRADFLVVPQDFDLEGLQGDPTVLRAGVDCCERGGALYALGEKIMAASDLHAAGGHNLQNALDAALMTRLDGVPAEAIARGLSGFRTDAHRIAPVGVYNGAAFFNDSKGTNISATLAAAACMTGNTALIVGGSDKGYDYDALFRGLPPGVTAVFVTGGNAARITAAAARVGYANAAECADLGAAVRRAASGGFDSVLFSPASASFDRYANYAERGEAFEREVKKLFTE